MSRTTTPESAPNIGDVDNLSLAPRLDYRMCGTAIVMAFTKPRAITHFIGLPRVLRDLAQYVTR